MDVLGAVMTSAAGVYAVLNTGIYKITNTVNGHFYIGSSVNLRKRKNEHFCRLRHNSNKCGILQSAYNKYGEPALVFSIMIYCSKDDLTYYEQTFVTNMLPEYNIRKANISTNLGFKMPDSAKMAISENHMGAGNPMYGKRLSEAHRKKIGDASRGRASSLRGTTIPDSRKEKIRLSMMGDNNPNSKVRKALKALHQLRLVSV